MRIILDTNVLLSNPDVLAFGSSKVKFIIPISVVREVGKRASKSLTTRYDELIRNSLRRGVVRIIPTPNFKGRDEKYVAKYGYVDAAVLNTALNYSKSTRRNDLYLATNDNELIEAASSAGINCVTSEGLYRLLSKEKHVDSALKASATGLRRRVLLNYFAGTVSGVVLSFCGIYLFNHWVEIRNSVSTVIFVLVVFIAGPSLYWFRSKFRTIYGLSEVIVGLYIAISQYNVTSYDAVFMIKLLGGLYIVVRGMDNFEKNVDRTILGPLWRRTFSRG